MVAGDLEAEGNMGKEAAPSRRASGGALRPACAASLEQGHFRSQPPPQHPSSDSGFPQLSLKLVAPDIPFAIPRCSPLTCGAVKPI